MVVEHTFISTLTPEEVQQAASEYLAARGFSPDPTPAQPPQPTSWEFIRGERRAASASSIAKLPQRLRIDYDRGRVAVAIQIEASIRWGGGGTLQLTGSSVTENRSKMVVHEQMLRGIVNGLETLLAYNGAGNMDYEQWDEAERRALELEQRFKRRRFRMLVLLAVVVTLLVAVPVLMFVLDFKG